MCGPIGMTLYGKLYQAFMTPIYVIYFVDFMHIAAMPNMEDAFIYLYYSLCNLEKQIPGFNGMKDHVTITLKLMNHSGDAVIR